MPLTLAKRTGALIASETLAINARVAQLEAAGRSIINLGAGEPDFEPPQSLIRATQAAAAHHFHYTSVKGIVELRTLLATLLKKRGVTIDPNRVVISSGAKQALYNLIDIICDHGDEVIVPTPAWVSYRIMIELCGARMVGIDTSQTGFSVTADQIAAKVTKRTKCVILTSPHNPTGSVIPERELRAIAALAVKHGFYIISDEVYEQFIYDNHQHFSLARVKSAQDNICTVNSFSKNFGVTGWRLGYCFGPAQVMEKVEQLQAHTTSNASSIAQYGLLEALKDHDVDTFFQKNRAEYQKRRDYFHQRLSAISECSVEKPHGAFYFFVKFSEKVTRHYQSAGGLQPALLETFGVAAIPGAAFGKEYGNYLRFSYSLPMSKLKAAADKIEQFCAV